MTETALFFTTYGSFLSALAAIFFGLLALGFFIKACFVENTDNKNSKTNSKRAGVCILFISMLFVLCHIYFSEAKDSIKDERSKEKEEILIEPESSNKNTTPTDNQMLENV